MIIEDRTLKPIVAKKRDKDIIDMIQYQEIYTVIAWLPYELPIVVSVCRSEEAANNLVKEMKVDPNSAYDAYEIEPRIIA